MYVYNFIYFTIVTFEWSDAGSENVLINILPSILSKEAFCPSTTYLLPIS